MMTITFAADRSLAAAAERPRARRHNNTIYRGSAPSISDGQITRCG